MDKEILLTAPKTGKLFEDTDDEVSYVRISIGNDLDAEDLNELKTMLDKGYTVIGKDSKEMTKKIKSATSVSDILPKEETGASKKTANVASTNNIKETEKAEQAEQSDNKAIQKESNMFRKMVVGFFALLVGGSAGAIGIMSILGIISISAVASSVALGIPFLLILGAGLYFTFRAARNNKED